MRIAGSGRHLTYCSNVHPGESWPAVRDAVLPEVARVRERLGCTEPFGVGLRLAARAARELEETPGELERLRAWLDKRGLYVFTLNGFPYGDFHEKPVKAAVYAPDWRDPERRGYSDRLARLLAALLPSELRYGSISTVPLGFARAFGDETDTEAACAQLLEHVARLHALEQETGRRICLALEPEPECVLETSQDCVALFDTHLRARGSLARLARALGCGTERAYEILHRHLGLCLDACHAAVEFEEPGAMLARLREAAIPVFKVQLSAGLRIEQMGPQLAPEVERYAEGVYLHQVVERHQDTLTRYLDLPEALSAHDGQAGREWRVHFHVPVFASNLGAFGSTQPFLAALCRALRDDEGGCAHFEVETYTWGVLPTELRGADLTDDLVKELRWVLHDSGLIPPEAP